MRFRFPIVIIDEDFRKATIYVAAGAVFVEKVYSWPGMGMVTVTATPAVRPAQA